jgi:lipoprotein LprG
VKVPGARERLIAVVAVAALAMAACGGSGSRPKAADHSATSNQPKASATPHLGASQILRRSRAAVDATSAVRFELSSSGVASGVTALIGGRGDLVRPDEMQGSMLVSDDGVSVTIKVVAAGGKFYALLPFTSKYAATNPASYGLGNPADLLSPTNGVSSLLTSMHAPKLGARARIDGELLDVISGTVPGREVPVLSDLDKAEPVSITAYISSSSFQLRRVQLAGPFTKAGVTTTYDVTITDYGEHVTLSAPKT